MNNFLFTIIYYRCLTGKNKGGNCENSENVLSSFEGFVDLLKLKAILISKTNTKKSMTDNFGSKLYPRQNTSENLTFLYSSFIDSQNGYPLFLYPSFVPQNQTHLNRAPTV